PYRTATYTYARRPETSPRLNYQPARTISTFLSHNVANRHCSLQNLPIRTSECNSIGRSRPCVVTPHAIEGCLVDAIGRSMPDHQSIPLFSLARAGLWPPASMLDDQFSFTHCLFAAACAASIRLAASTSMSG